MPVTSISKGKRHVDEPLHRALDRKRRRSTSVTFMHARSKLRRPKEKSPMPSTNGHSFARRPIQRRPAAISVSSQDTFEKDTLEEDTLEDDTDDTSVQAFGARTLQPLNNEYQVIDSSEDDDIFRIPVEDDELQILGSDGGENAFPALRRTNVTENLNQLRPIYIESENDADVSSDDRDGVLRTLHVKRNLKQSRKTYINFLVGYWEEIDRHRYNGIHVHPHGSDLELIDGTFMRVKHVWQHAVTGEVRIEGLRFVRQSSFAPFFNNSPDGICLELEIPKDSENQTGFTHVSVNQIKREACLILTNRSEEMVVRLSGVLYCRWKVVRYFEDKGQRREMVEVEFARLRAKECDESYSVDDDLLRLQWRGTQRGRVANGLYTAVDGFCCSGGWTRGTLQAGGFEIVRSFDLDQKACKSYEFNFPGTECLEISAHDYCTRDGDPLVDVLHISAPCKTFSAAHTRIGPDDEANFAASFCIDQMLKKDKPRVVTLENTGGLWNRHEETRNAILAQFTSSGYSLRFGVLKMRYYGLAQLRNRLIAIASCPGERLPPFPAHTHDDNPDSDLPYFIDIPRTLSRIKHNDWPNHNPEKMRLFNKPVLQSEYVNTITCGGGDSYHYTGKRDYTARELATLNGFPLNHVWPPALARTVAVRQIGNAIPPLFTKIMMRTICAFMRESDGLPYTPAPDTTPEEEMTNYYMEDNMRSITAQGFTYEELVQQYVTAAARDVIELD